MCHHFFFAELKTLTISDNITNAEWETVTIERHQSYILVTHRGAEYTLQGNFPFHGDTRNPIVELLLGGTNTPGTPLYIL